tara:strand:- start:493 stop:990 length:498 start_codon:yes stop_codon:yes gene_type:complete
MKNDNWKQDILVQNFGTGLWSVNDVSVEVNELLGVVKLRDRNDIDNVITLNIELIDRIAKIRKEKSNNICINCEYDLGEGYVNCGMSSDGICPECGQDQYNDLLSTFAELENENPKSPILQDSYIKEYLELAYLDSRTQVQTDRWIDLLENLESKYIELRKEYTR